MKIDFTDGSCLFDDKDVYQLAGMVEEVIEIFMQTFQRFKHKCGY